MDGIKTRRITDTAIIAAAALGAVWLTGRFILPCLLPFILAFLTAWFLDPAISFLCRRFRMKRAFAAVCCDIFIFFVLFGVAALGISRLIYQVVDLLRELPGLLGWIPSASEKLTDAVNRYVVSAPEGVQEYIIGAIESISDKILELPGELSAAALRCLPEIAGKAPAAILFTVTYIIGVFFITRSYGDIKQFLLRQIPEKSRPRARALKRDLADGFVMWLKAQLTLIAATFAELTVALTVLRFRYAALIALITALVDALPVLGTGTVLLPWAAVLLFTGDTAGAVGIAVTYIAVTLIRSFLEPKLVGSKFGVHPAAALAAIYSGFRIGGVGGMILFPVALIMLSQMNEKGYITLWK